MEEEKGLITLKEAASISGYSADYIGQLIRAGKISGKQVYTNITWMTTAEAVLEYKKNGKSESENKKTLKEVFKNKKRMIAIELNILKLFFHTFKSALPMLIAVIVSLLIVGVYMSYLFINKNINNLTNNKNKVDQSILY
jgi:hypothetical protein